MAKNIRKIVAANVRRLRVKQGLSQAELSARAKLTARYVSKIENAGQNLTIESLAALARVLGVEPAALLGSAVPMPVESPKTPAEALDGAIEMLRTYRATL